MVRLKPAQTAAIATWQELTASEVTGLEHEAKPCDCHAHPHGPAEAGRYNGLAEAGRYIRARSFDASGLEPNAKSLYDRVMLGPLIKGFALTFRHMFKKPVTVNYPYEKVPVFPKYRGKQVLMRDENGLEKCVACGLCSVACPADAIYLEAAENDGTVLAGPRYASVYQIHKTRCIFCGMCEEACPVSAIFMGKDYELAVYSKDDFIWDKADLLVAPPARPSL
jgi:NADH-quinone oxidoreductase subunit I